VDQALEQWLTQKNIKFKFKTTCIWLINPKVMERKIRPSKVYTIAININNAKNEEDYTIEEEIQNNQHWGEDSAIVKFFHMQK